MILLVSGATSTMARLQDDRLGQLLVPGAMSWGYPDDGRPWACDNGAFSGFDADGFMRMLDHVHASRRTGRALFVALPDVVGDAAATLALYRTWRPRLQAYGLPLALVMQDGLQLHDVPWATLDAMFVGGTTEFKLGAAARELVAASKARGKWVHMGRVNTARRLRYASDIGCDSVDGSGFSRWPDIRIPKALRWMSRHEQQPCLDFAAPDPLSA